MGSGTTIGESHKLGFTSFGQDINPIACESVNVAFGNLDQNQINYWFGYLSQTVGSRIRNLYKTTDNEGNYCDVLYYFWVKVIPCVHCHQSVDTFSSYIFAKNAYPDRKPEVQIYCPKCGNIFQSHNELTLVRCNLCNFEFNPHIGPVQDSIITCSSCHKTFSILDSVHSINQPPKHRLYAKLLLKPKTRNNISQLMMLIYKGTTKVRQFSKKKSSLVTLFFHLMFYRMI